MSQAFLTGSPSITSRIATSRRIESRVSALELRPSLKTCVAVMM
jgi:hypothetical protein